MWVVNTKSVLNQLRKKNIECYIIGTDEYYKYIKTSDIIFSTHANITFDKSPNTIYVELWHGVGLKPVGYLSKNILQSDKKWYNSIKNSIDYFIVPSEFWRVIFSCIFNFEVERIIPLGYPKLDDIKNPNSRKKLEKLNKKITTFDKIIYYMPTFHKGCGRIDDENTESNNIFNLEKYDETIFLEYLKKNNYLLVIKYHPSEESSVLKKQNDNIFYLDEELLSKENITISELLNASNILITDYSSLGIEYLFLNKVTIYLGTHLKEYNKKRGIIFDDYDFWTNNVNAKNINELIYLINININVTKEDKRKKLFFGNLKDGGCNNIIDYFIKNSYYLNNNITSNLTKEIILQKRIDELELEKENDYNNHKKAIEALESYKNKLENEINKIYNSRSWKILSIFVKIKNWRKKK